MDVAGASYGADEVGQICGFLFRPGQSASPLSSAEAADWLAEQRRGDLERDTTLRDAGFAWLHFNLSHNAARRWLEEHARLSDAFFEALQEGMHSTRIERADQGLIAVINDVHFSFSFEPSDISTLWMSVDQHLLVTARLHPLRSIDKLRSAVKAGEVLRSTVELLEFLLRNQADVLVEIVREVATKIDSIEDDLLAGKLIHKRVRLGVLRRLLVRLQRLLAPEPAALFRLLQHPLGWMAEPDVLQLHQATEEFSVVLRDMASLQERIKLLQEEIAAQVNEDNNRSLFVLTVVTVLALPINIIAGLLGMNVGGIPLAGQAHGFWIVVFVIATFTVVAGWLAFRSQRDR